MLNTALLGAGRIAGVHATAISTHPGSRLVAVADINAEAATKLAAQYGAEARTTEAILADKAIDAVLIATSTDTHSDLIERAVAAGKAVLCEKPVDLSLARAQACIRHAVGLCDLFLPSLEDMTALTGLTQAQDIIDWSHAQGAAQVVLKLGADGAIASDGKKQHIVPGHTVSAVDATGAGDCFAGNLLARLSACDSLWDATAYANAAAALSLQGYGAVAPLPRHDAVLNHLLKEQTP